MDPLQFEDYKTADDIPKNEIEHENEGIFISHEGDKFKNALLQMALKCSKKAIFSNVDLASINRPASIASAATQLESLVKPLSVVIPYFHEMQQSDDFVYRTKILLSAMVAYMGESLLAMTENIPILPLLGETLQVTL